MAVPMQMLPAVAVQKVLPVSQMILPWYEYDLRPFSAAVGAEHLCFAAQQYVFFPLMLKQPPEHASQTSLYTGCPCKGAWGTVT